MIAGGLGADYINGGHQADDIDGGDDADTILGGAGADIIQTARRGRIPVVEIMRASPVIRKAILEGRVDSLPQAIANRDNGMQLFDQHLADLYNEDVISTREALRLASNPEALTAAMRGISRAETSSGLVQ